MSRNPTFIRLRKIMAYSIINCVVASFEVISAAAQQLPSPMLSIPRTSNASLDWGFSGGFDISSGKYGAKCGVNITAITCATTGTTLISIPMTGMLQVGRLRLEATVPFHHIQGPGRLSGNFGIPVIVAPSTADPKHRSGLGDISIGGAWLISRENSLFPGIEIAGVTKLPTAGNGFGTGKSDFGAQLSLHRTLTPWLSAYGSLGYLWVGETNSIKLHSGAHAAGGALFKFGSFGGGAILDFQQSSWTGAPDQVSFNPYLTWYVAGGLGVTIYTTVGMTRASPNRAIGFRLSL